MDFIKAYLWDTSNKFIFLKFYIMQHGSCQWKIFSEGSYLNLDRWIGWNIEILKENLALKYHCELQLK